MPIVDEDVFSSSPAHPSHTRQTTNRPRPLKRSASNASLPTPPRDSKRTHSTNITFVLSSDEDDEVHMHSPSSPSRSGARPVKNAPRGGARTRSASQRSHMHTGAEEITGLAAIHATSNRSPSPFRTSDSEVIQDRLESSKLSSSPIPAEPRTPPRSKANGKAKAKAPAPKFPVEDEEDNPFVVSKKRRSAKPPPKGGLKEPETLDFVFRGVKTTFPNPYFDAPKPEGVDPSTLPVDHIDYTPPKTFKPKLLFPPAANDTDEEDDEEDNGRVLPAQRRLFAEPSFSSSTARAGSSSGSGSGSSGVGLGVEMKAAVRNGKASAGTVVALAHGPVRAGERPLRATSSSTSHHGGIPSTTTNSSRPVKRAPTGGTKKSGSVWRG